MEATIWVIKYLIVASEDRMFFLKIKIGIIDNKLISKPTHAPNQEDAEMEMKVLEIKNIKEMRWNSFIIRKEILFYH